MKNALIILSSTFSLANATTLSTLQEIDMDQTHLGTSTDAAGVITATYEGTTTQFFEFDTQGGRYELDNIDLNFGISNNKYHVGLVGGTEFQEPARVDALADVFMYNRSGDVVFSATNVNYQFFTFTNAVDTAFNPSEIDLTFTRSVFADGFTNTAVLDALENGGVRFEIQESITWTVNDTNDNSIATSLEAGPAFGNNFNNYDTFVRFNAVEVVPEPSSAALLGLAGVSVLLRRRR